jgi:hypothetical protein
MPPAAADTPFAPSAAHEQRIRLRAYYLWESEDKPLGQAAAYWERARELDAMAQAPATASHPNADPMPRTADGVLIEDAALQENLGEFPSRFTDQGETMPTPESREIAREFRDGEK